MHQQLLVAAQTDPLTGLGHHGAFQETLAKNFAQDASLSVLMIDLDDFKAYNDRYGHQAGDRLLRRIAEGLRSGVRTSDMVFRYGGDEFAVVLPGTDAVGAEIVAGKVLAGLAAIPSVPGRQRRTATPVRASIGVASHPGDARDPHDLVAVADTALYVAKELGKARVVPASALPAHLQEMRALLERVMNEPMPRLANGSPDLVRFSCDRSTTNSARSRHASLTSTSASRRPSRAWANCSACGVTPSGCSMAAALVADIGRLATEAPDERMGGGLPSHHRRPHPRAVPGASRGRQHRAHPSRARRRDRISRWRRGRHAARPARTFLVVERYIDLTRSWPTSGWPGHRPPAQEAGSACRARGPGPRRCPGGPGRRPDPRPAGPR